MLAKEKSTLKLQSKKKKICKIQKVHYEKNNGMIVR